MRKEMIKVGQIHFQGRYLDVYDDLDTPLFLAVEIAKLIDYSNGRTDEMMKLVEDDEKILINVGEGLSRQQRRALERQASKLSGITGNSGGTGQGGNPNKWFVTELGLYNILAQSRKPVARTWRRVIHSNLILLRKQHQLTIEDQFDEWNAMADDLYVDPDTGILMQSVTVQGGDVIQVPYEEDGE